MLQTLCFFSSSKCRLFHNATFFWFLYYSHFIYRVCSNLKENSGTNGLIWNQWIFDIDTDWFKGALWQCELTGTIVFAFNMMKMQQTVFHSYKKAGKTTIYNFTTIPIPVKVKVKVNLEQAAKAQRGNRGITLLFL